MNISSRKNGRAGIPTLKSGTDKSGRRQLPIATHSTHNSSERPLLSNPSNQTLQRNSGIWYYFCSGRFYRSICL